MFAQSIIKKNLGEAQSRIDTLPPNQRLTLKLYSVEQSLAAQKFLESKMDEEKTKFIKPLSRIEEDFILNEITVCKNYFLYWARRYAFILSTLTTKDETKLLFDPTIGQKMVLRAYSEMEAELIAIMTQKDKARQLGSTTIDQIIGAHTMQFKQNVTGLSASSTPAKTWDMVSKASFVWKNEPFWIKPEDMQVYESGEVLCEVESRNNIMHLKHGTARTDIGRGGTPTWVHLTELVEFGNPKIDVDAALLRAIHEHPSVFVSMESTANGKVGKGKWWYDTWRFNKDYWPQRRSRFRPLFLPWFVGRDLYPTPTWLRAHPIPKDFQPKETTIAHVLKAEQYVRSGDSPELTEMLGKSWKMPLEQIWFYEVDREEAVYKDNLSLYLQEMASNPEESFQRHGKGLLSVEVVERIRNEARHLALWQGKPATFAIVGDGIHTDLEPAESEVDKERSPITIKSDWDASKKPQIFHFIPLIHHPDKWERRLFIFEFPNVLTYDYANGIDCAEGIGADNTACELIRKSVGTQPAEQVAEFASGWISAAELLPWALAIGTFYSHSSNEFVKQCRQAIEIKFGGYELQHNLRKAGWSEFHRWKGAYDNKNLKTLQKIGFDTNAWTRPMLITEGRASIRDGFFKINSPFFIDELEALQKDDDNEKIEAKGEEKDDRCISGFIGFFSLHEMELIERDKGAMARRLHQVGAHAGGKVASVSHQWIRNESSNLIEDPSPKDERMIQVSQLNQKYKMNTLLPTLDDEE